MTTAERIKKAKTLLKKAEAEIRAITVESLSIIDEAKKAAQKHPELRKHPGRVRPEDEEATDHAGSRYRLSRIVAQQIENTCHVIDNFPGVDWKAVSKPKKQRRKKS